MSDEPAELVVATEEAAAARARLAATFAELQTRLNPKTLARDAIQEMRDTGQDVARGTVSIARRHPVGVVGAVAAIGLFAARRPILSLFRRGKRDTKSRIPRAKPVRGILPATKGNQQ